MIPIRKRVYLTLVAAGLVFGALCAHAVAHASDGPPSLASEGTSSATLMLVTSIVAYGAYGLLAVASWLGGQHGWKWTRWLRVGRRQAHIAAGLGALAALLGQAEAGDLKPYVLIQALVQWGQMRSMPGAMEPKPSKTDADLVAPT